MSDQGKRLMFFLIKLMLSVKSDELFLQQRNYFPTIFYRQNFMPTFFLLKVMMKHGVTINIFTRPLFLTISSRSQKQHSSRICMELLSQRPSFIRKVDLANMSTRKLLKTYRSIFQHLIRYLIRTEYLQTNLLQSDLVFSRGTQVINIFPIALRWIF